MDPSVHTTISHLGPGLCLHNLTITVDRVIIWESLHAVRDEKLMMKAVDSVDILCWDEVGTRIIASLSTPKVIESHGALFSEGCSYRISRYLVNEPGLAVHSRFHLELDELSSVEFFHVPFVDRVFNLRCPSEIPTGLSSMGTIFDVCGFVQHAANVGVNVFRGYVDHDVVIEMDSIMKDSYGKERHSVIVHLRGSFGQVECAKIKKLLHHNQTRPFILIKHLRLTSSSLSGRPVLHSVADATRVVYNPNQQEVIELRAALIAG